MGPFSPTVLLLLIYLVSLLCLESVRDKIFLLDQQGLSNKPFTTLNFSCSNPSNLCRKLDTKAVYIVLLGWGEWEHPASLYPAQRYCYFAWWAPHPPSAFLFSICYLFEHHDVFGTSNNPDMHRSHAVACAWPHRNCITGAAHKISYSHGLPCLQADMQMTSGSVDALMCRKSMYKSAMQPGVCSNSGRLHAGLHV